MLNKDKTTPAPEGTTEKITVVNHESVKVVWDSFFWCGQKVTVTTRHKLIGAGSYDNQTGEDAQVVYELYGYVTDIDLELDCDCLLAAFDGNVDHSLITSIYMHTSCDTTSSPEVTI